MRCPANTVVYGLISLAQNGGKGSGVLTELGFEGEGRAKTMAMLTGGGAGTVIAGGVRRPFSGRLDSAGRLVGHLRWCHVVREIRCSTTVSNCSRNRVPAAAIPEANPGAVVAETEGSGLGVVPGARTELRRWLR